MTIGEKVVQEVARIRRERKQPRRCVVNWMKRNNYWYREIVAKEWSKQTGEDWETILWASVKAA